MSASPLVALPLGHPRPVSALILLFTTALVLFGDEAGKQNGITYLYLLGLLQLAPILVGLARRQVGYLDLILANHFIQFTLARINATLNLDKTESVPPEALAAAQELFICTVLILVAYYGVRVLLFRAHFSQVTYAPLTMPRHYLVVGLFINLVIPVFYGYFPSGVVTVLLSLNTLVSVAIFCSDVPGGERFASVSKLVIILATFVSFCFTGSMIMMGYAVGIYMITLILRGRLGRSYFAFLAIFVMVVLQTVKFDYRLYIYGDGTQTPPPLRDRLTYLGELLEKAYLSSDVDQDERSEKLARGFSRVGDNSLEVVLSQTPRRVPFWNGETYYSIPFMFIPRFLWPEKPGRDFWNKYGRLYGILSDNDTATSVGVGFLAEAYMNFGFSGLYTMAMLFGLFVVLVERGLYFLLGGNFQFTFILFLLPLLNYSIDLGSMINSIVIGAGVFLAVRWHLMRATLRDAYSFP